MLGIVRLYRGDAAGAQAALRRATELDPLSPMNLVCYGKSLYYGRRYGEARAALRQLNDLDAANLGAGEVLALTDLELGLADEARAAMRSMASSHHEGEKREYIAMMSALVDTRTGRAPRVLPDLRPRANAHVDTSTASALCLALGRRDAAIAWLEIGMRDRARSERGLIALDPRLASLRGDQRFKALVAGIS
ncbi:hypothetical protein WPS_03260 [Vulcanimicrobium alpinum]|uniref:Tetratricopeptide repeat protein n=1 Tax=Vulcanimicrobium alpinum TaxID=3016050 RepID=A0AAN1XTT8_UNVUL|nr:hypothetical protein WPS_03260 [Vulcanimicrobium alpinum]